MKSRLDPYSMLICSKYVISILDMNNITIVNSKFKETIDKLHFNPFQINQKTRKYFSNLQTQWLFDKNDEIFEDGDISGYYVHYEVSYQIYLTMKDNYRNINFRRIIYSKDDRWEFGDEIPIVVNKLDDFLFTFSKNKEITIPDSIVEIGNHCFEGCGLMSITISSRLTNVGENVFCCCDKLSSITLPSLLTSLNKRLFSGCNGLTTIKYSPFVVNFDDYLFQYAKGILTISIPTSITRIGDKCFDQCKLTSLTIPSSVVEFGKEAFIYNDELKEVELPNNMMELSDRAFYRCLSLTKINIPSSLTKIGDECFEGCYNLNEINMPMNVIKIGNNSFKNCLKLQSITGNIDVCIKNKGSFVNTLFFEQLNKN